MPKKSRKKKKGKKIKKRKPSKRKKKVSRKTKKRRSFKPKKRKIKRKVKPSVSQPKEDGEKIYKTKSEWIKKALVNIAYRTVAKVKHAFILLLELEPRPRC